MTLTFIPLGLMNIPIESINLDIGISGVTVMASCIKLVTKNYDNIELGLGISIAFSELMSI